MEQFVVTGPFYQVNKGQVFGMSKAAAKRRKHLVKEIKSEVYEALIPFHFKNGEVISLDPDLVQKKGMKQITEKSEFEKQEAEKPIEEQIKRLTSAKLEEFYYLNCDEAEFPDDEDLTNARRKEMILEWFKSENLDKE